MRVERFHDDGRYTAAYGNTALVVCPTCGKSASVTPTTDASGCCAPHRLSCVHCGCVRDWPAKSPPKQRMRWGKTRQFAGQQRQYGTGTFTRVGPTRAQLRRRGKRDRYFNQPLYLQTACAGHTLWAYNVEHLNALEAFVSASLRESAPNTHWSMPQVLPQWLIVAKHRDEALRAIQRLRQKLLG